MYIVFSDEIVVYTMHLLRPNIICLHEVLFLIFIFCHVLEQHLSHWMLVDL